MNGPTYGELMDATRVHVGDAVHCIAAGLTPQTFLDGRHLAFSVAARHLGYIAMLSDASGAERHLAEQLARTVACYRADWETSYRQPGQWLQAARSLGMAHDILVSHHGVRRPPRSPWVLTQNDSASWRYAVGTTAQIVSACAVGTPKTWLPSDMRLGDLAKTAGRAMQGGGTITEPQIYNLHAAPYGMPTTEGLDPSEAALGAYREVTRLAHLENLNRLTSMATFRIVAITATIAFQAVDRVTSNSSTAINAVASIRRRLMAAIRDTSRTPLITRAPCDLIDAGLEAKRLSNELRAGVSAAMVKELTELAGRLSSIALELKTRVPAMDEPQLRYNANYQRWWSSRRLPAAPQLPNTTRRHTPPRHTRAGAPANAHIDSSRADLP